MADETTHTHNLHNTETFTDTDLSDIDDNDVFLMDEAFFLYDEPLNLTLTQDTTPTTDITTQPANTPQTEDIQPQHDPLHEVPQNPPQNSPKTPTHEPNTNKANTPPTSQPPEQAQIPTEANSTVSTHNTRTSPGKDTTHEPPTTPDEHLQRNIKSNTNINNQTHTTPTLSATRQQAITQTLPSQESHTYEELCQKLHKLKSLRKAHKSQADLMTHHLRKDTAPTNLQITKHSLTPLPPHFKEHWDKILHETSLTLTHLLLKYHEEEGNILDTELETTTRLLRYIATPEQLKQYTNTLTHINTPDTLQDALHNQTLPAHHTHNMKHTDPNEYTKYTTQTTSNRKHKLDHPHSDTPTHHTLCQDKNPKKQTENKHHRTSLLPTPPRKRKALLPTPHTKYQDTHTPTRATYTQVKQGLLPTPKRHNIHSKQSPLPHTTKHYPDGRAKTPIPLMSITFTQQNPNTHNQKSKNSSRHQHTRPPNHNTPKATSERKPHTHPSPQIKTRLTHKHPRQEF